MNKNAIKSITFQVYSLKMKTVWKVKRFIKYFALIVSTGGVSSTLVQKILFLFRFAFLT